MQQRGKAEEVILKSPIGEAEKAMYGEQKRPGADTAISMRAEADPGESPLVLTDSAIQLPSGVTPEVKTERKITLQKGETLRLLALNLFGNREFWVYIYLANKNNIPNPNVVPVGTQLTIPDPSQYHINASDPQSVSEAKTLGDNMLKNR